MTDKEKNEIYSYVVDKLNLNLNNNKDSIIYNYCKFYILDNTDTTQIDKEQSLSAMSRSLCLYFILLSIVVFINNFFQPDIIKIILVISSIIFAIFLFYRYIRFAKLRYIKVFRRFYYKVVVNKE